MEIVSLANFSFEQLFKAFSEAFKDYDFQLSKIELKNMLQRRGFEAGLSFAAVEDNAIVSFTLNGIGRFNGIKTAYDTGTGTIPSFRGRSLATQIFEFSLPYLKKAGIKQYLLEVLQHNAKACKIYKNIGFKVSREFNYFVADKAAVQVIERPNNGSLSIRIIDVDQCSSLTDQMEFTPSWQNSFEAIDRQVDKFTAIGAFIDEKLVGYCITELYAGDITQLLVHADHRRNGVGTLLLERALECNKHNAVKVINTDIDCHSLTHFLATFSIAVSGKQYEMIKKLDD
ncbi:GNAT family N-acetyltransferase [Carboxylicivirga sp. RSCT41]|uniref:GNAT family N-acetyltransferase n=1 Tax=Carboxylicivirga agarovorans TaxID=3417570 RepID=UPI003D3283D6